ncbi:MAG: acyltransferase [Terrisporobacter sp.]|uniref:acyltransferase n=1 Tax=Terrisporobacter sp. TaxID=1965305 RepID=UPI002FCA0259
MDKYISNKIKNMSLIMTFLVVVLHSNNLENPSLFNVNTLIQNVIGQGIARLAVPIFFFISGYLFFYKFNPSKSAWISKFKKRFKSLFIPYVIWCTGWLVILYIVELTAFGRAMFSDRIITDYNFIELFKNTYIYPLPYQFWYIRALMLNVILSPIIYYVVVKLKDKALPIIAVFWFFDVIYYPILMFAIGACLSIGDYDLHFANFRKRIKLLGVGFVSGVIIKTIIIYMPQLPNQQYLELLGENVIILFGIPFAWLLYDVIGEIYKDKFDLGKEMKLAKYGIFIYFFHIPLQSIIKKLWFKVMPITDISSLLIFFVAPVITIIICALTGIFLRKYMNKFYGLLTGGR